MSDYSDGYKDSKNKFKKKVNVEVSYRIATPGHSANALRSLFYQNRLGEDALRAFDLRELHGGLCSVRLEQKSGYNFKTFEIKALYSYSALNKSKTKLGLMLVDILTDRRS